MKKHTLLIIFVVLILFGLKFFVQPALNRRAAIKVVKTVLDQWSNKDLLKAIDQWEDPENYPPIYNVDEFKIKDYDFKEVDKILYAKIRAMIIFEAGNLLPSGEYWYFVLKDGRFGWKITDFYIENPSSLSKNSNVLPTLDTSDILDEVPEIDPMLRPISSRPITSSDIKQNHPQKKHDLLPNNTSIF